MQELKHNVMYSPKWQAVRVSLLGKWSTLEGVEQNIGLLRNYLGEGPSFTELWRVLNLLNAVRMGYNGQKLVGTAMDRRVIEYRTDIQTLYTHAAEQGGCLEEVTEELVEQELEAVNLSTRKLIYANLSNRLNLHAESKHREDLRWFLILLERRL